MSPGFYGYSLLGDAYEMAEKLDEALNYYSKCLRDHPKDRRALLGAARLAKRQGDTSRAIAAYRLAILRAPDLEIAYDLLDTLLLDSGSAENRVNVWRQNTR